MSKRDNYGALPEKRGPKHSENALLEFGFYCERLKPHKTLASLHTLYKSDPHNLRAFKNLYLEYCPEGMAFAEWRKNPQCEHCTHKLRGPADLFCHMFKHQLESCAQFKPIRED